jgi:hypothetical protein
MDEQTLDLEPIRIYPPLENLAKALVAFQKELPTVTKGKTANAGSYSYTYADLASVTAAVIPLLSKNGLAFTVTPRATEGGYEIVGVLLHTSGESIEGALPLYGRNPQEIGSALSYGRRYLMGVMTGCVTDDDDDGASSKSSARTKSEPAKDWGPIADTAEMMTHVDDVRALWDQEGVAKAPKAIQDRIKAHVNSLKAEDGA